MRFMPLHTTRRDIITFRRASSSSSFSFREIFPRIFIYWWCGAMPRIELQRFHNDDITRARMNCRYVSRRERFRECRSRVIMTILISTCHALCWRDYAFTYALWFTRASELLPLVAFSKGRIVDLFSVIRFISLSAAIHAFSLFSMPPLPMTGLRASVLRHVISTICSRAPISLRHFHARRFHTTTTPSPASWFFAHTYFAPEVSGNADAYLDAKPYFITIFMLFADYQSSIYRSLEVSALTIPRDGYAS